MIALDSQQTGSSFLLLPQPPAGVLVGENGGGGGGGEREGQAGKPTHSVSLDEKAGECCVRIRGCVEVCPGRVVRVLEVHLLPGVDVDDGPDSRLAVGSVLAVGYSSAHDVVVHVYSAVSILARTEII